MYTKFDPTKKVLCVIQIIENEDNTDEVDSREPCLPDPDLFVQDVTSNTESVTAEITSDNGKSCTIVVEGTDVISDFDTTMFPNYNGNGAEIEFNMPIDGPGTYKIVSQNPAYRHFTTDPSISVANGIYTKSKTYTIEDNELIMKMILTDDAGPISVKLYDENNVLLKTYNVINKVTFMA